MLMAVRGGLCGASSAPPRHYTARYVAQSDSLTDEPSKVTTGHMSISLPVGESKNNSNVPSDSMQTSRKDSSSRRNDRRFTGGSGTASVAMRSSSGSRASISSHCRSRSSDGDRRWVGVKIVLYNARLALRQPPEANAAA
jgi:hypothetical protein